MQPHAFVRVTPSYAGIVNADVNEIWNIVKQWAPSLWIKDFGGTPVHFQVLSGETGEQVGATRASVVGEGVVVEQLVAVDAEEHYLTWKCISDPRSINPFPGSFVNYINTLRFTPTSKPSQTLAQWDGDLWTDHEMEETMQHLLSDFYQEALGKLERQINEAKARRAPRLTQQPQYDDYAEPVSAPPLPRPLPVS